MKYNKPSTAKPTLKSNLAAWIAMGIIVVSFLINFYIHSRLPEGCFDDYWCWGDTYLFRIGYSSLSIQIIQPIMILLITLFMFIDWLKYRAIKYGSIIAILAAGFLYFLQIFFIGYIF